MPLFGPAGSATAVVTGNSGTVVAERLDGSVVILWVDQSPGANQYDLRGKVIAADGTVLVPEFLVSTVADGNQDHQAVATRASDGAFLAVWQSYPTTPPGQPAAPTLQAQLFDAAGNRLGAEFSISPGAVERAEVVPLADGGFMVVWETGASGSHQIKAQRLDATGAEVGSELTLYGEALSSFRLADAHQLASGELVLSVRQQSTNVGVPTTAFIQTFDLAGAATDGPETIGSEFPVLALTMDGGFFATYRSGSNRAVQRFDADAEKVGGPIIVSLTNATFGTDVDIMALPDGGFLLSWNGTSFAGGGEAIFAQTFTAAGVRSGPVLELTTSVGTSLSLVDVTTEDDGSFELTWNAGSTLMTQRFEPQPYPASGTFTGTAGTDNLIGGEGDDLIQALGGNDRLFGWTGNDRLEGGAGADFTDGGPGDDVHLVDSQSDVVFELSGEGYDTVLASVSYVLGAGVDVEVLATDDDAGTASINLTGNELANLVVGNAGANTLRGGGGIDVIRGLGGDDLIFGDAGNDQMEGGLGNDSFIVDDAGDIVVEAVGEGFDSVAASVSYVLTAGAEIEVLATTNNNGFSAINLTGNAFNQGIVGNRGNNVLDGGGGADVLQGGDGDDTYIVDADDVVVEGTGVDTVRARESYILAAGVSVEILSTTDAAGTAPINLVGNEFDQTIIGNNGNNYLNGAGGADFMIGGLGNDTYIVDNPFDVVSEAVGGGFDNVAASANYVLNAGAEIEVLSTTDNTGTATIYLVGNEFGQSVIGNDGSNYLNGGGGVDVLIGRGGNDTMIVDSNDFVIEDVGGGFDNVAASANYILQAGAEIEVLSTTNNAGTAAIYLVGNEFGQSIIGNDGSNYLAGGGGVDVLIGRGGNDTMIVDSNDVVIEDVGGGFDNVAASANYILQAGAEIEVLSTTNNAGTAAIYLVGNEFGQSIIGNDGSNYINGAGGADVMQGRAGNDTYIVDNAGDVVIDGVGQGFENVAASVSYALNAGAEIEVLSTTDNAGTGAINLTGNEFGQSLIGNAGNNILDGRLGNDLLIGGAGADTFQFTTALGANNIDTLRDFASGSDKIALDDAIFTAIGAPGALNPNAFFAGTAAHDADDRIIYDQATGNLYYDADGNLAGAQILFATLETHPAIAASDFSVI